jgi:hypothetical protein
VRDLQKAIFEGIIPLLGFYYWEWSFYFILLFYVIDWIAKEVLVNFQAKAIYKTQGGEKSTQVWKRAAVSGLIYLIATIFNWQVIQLMRDAEFDFSERIWAFLSYMDMGIAQGLVLVPLIALSVWLTYKMEFIKLGMNHKTTMSALWLAHNTAAKKLLIFSTMMVMLHLLWVPNETFLVWGAVLLPVVNQYSKKYF